MITRILLLNILFHMIIGATTIPESPTPPANILDNNYSLDINISNIPKVPQLNVSIIIEDNNSLKHNLFAPEIPNVATSFEDNNSLKNNLFAPEIPNVETSFEDNNSLKNNLFAPEIPNIETSFEDNNSLKNNLFAPEIPNIKTSFDDNNSLKNNLFAPETPNVETSFDDNNSLKNNLFAPETPNVETSVERNISKTLTAPTSPNIAKYIDINVSAKPSRPNDISITHSYVMGNVILPKNISDSIFTIHLISLAGFDNKNIIDKYGFWAIEFPLNMESKAFILKIVANQSGVITEYFIDGETLEISLVQTPDTKPLLVTSSTGNIGQINLAEIDKDYSIIQGSVITNNNDKFSFDITNIETGQIRNIYNASLDFNKFGFKIYKHNKYLLQMNINKNEYIINYKDGTEDIQIFAKNSLELNLSAIPKFDKYLEPLNDINITIDYSKYLSDAYKIKGSVKTDENQTLILTILNAEDGTFLKEMILDNSNKYEFSTILGRDLKNQSLAIYLTKPSNPNSHYLYDAVTKSFKQFRDSDFKDAENGFLPNIDFTPLKIIGNPINLIMDFTALKIYDISGHLLVPQNLKMGKVCKNEQNITKYGLECNSSTENLGLNSASLLFINLNNSVVTSINLDNNLNYILENDTPRNFDIDLELSTFKEIDNKFVTEYFNIAKNINLTDYNQSINFDINLEKILNLQLKMSGNITVDNSISEVQINFIDSQTMNSLGFSNNLNQYFVSLDKFSDNNISNNDILIELEITKNGNSQTFFFDGEKLISSESIKYVQIGQDWIIDKNSSGFISLQDSKYLYQLDLDLPILLSDFENNLFTLSGNIQLGELFDTNSSILIELINKDSGQLTEPIFYFSDNNSSDFFFELKIKDSGNYIISIILNGQTFILNTKTKKLLDIDFISFHNGVLDSSNSGFISFDSSHKNITFNINPDEIINSNFKISGNISDIKVSMIYAYDINGNLLGTGEVLDNGDYKIILQTVQVSDEIYLKIQSSSDTYFIGSNNFLVETNSIIQTSSLNLGSDIQPIIIKNNLTQNIAFQELYNNLDKMQYRIYGEILNSNETIYFQIIDIINQKYFGLVQITDNNFSIDLPSGGEFMLYIETDSQSLFYDFNNSKFISANSVNFINLGDDWLPDWKQTGSFLINTENRKKKVSIDFSKIANSFHNLAGNIILPSNFLLGEVCKIGEDIENNDNCNPTYNNYKLISQKSAFISIVDRATNQEVAFSPIKQNLNTGVDENIEYQFTIDIDNNDYISRDLIFYIYLQEKDENQAKSYKLMYDFENNKTINSKVDSTQSWLTLSSSKDDIVLDISNFLTSQKKITLKLQTPTDFILENGNSALVSLYNYEDAKFVDSIKIYSDKNITFEVGDKNGKYLFEIELDNSEYAQTFFFDFGGSHNIDNLSILKSDEVQWIEKNKNIIPNTNYLEVNESKIFLATISNSSGFQVSGSVNSDIEMKAIDIVLHDYKNNIRYLETVRNGNYEFHNIKDGNYSISILATDLSGNFFQVFISETGFINNFDLIWSLETREDNSTFYSPLNLQIFDISSNISENINLEDFLKRQDRYSLNIQSDTNIKNAELFIPNSSINYFLNSNSLDINFSNIAPKNGYYLNFQIDGKEYYLNGETEKLESGINWNAYQNEIQVCPINNSWDCEWKNSINWIWKPNIPALNLANLSEDKYLEIALPQESKVSGIIEFGDSFQNSKFNVVAYQLNNSIYQKQEFQTNENGDLHISFKAVPMENYRLEIFNEKIHYVLIYDGNYNLILNSNSWKTETFGAKTETLININQDLNFGNIIVPTLKNINFNITNLDENESVSIILFDNKNYFYNDNSYNSENIEILLNSGLYKMAVFSSKHKSGYAISLKGEKNITDFSWDLNLSLDISVSQDLNFTIPFSSNSDLRAVSGTVNIGDGDIENGWIEIFSDTIRKGTEVSQDGRYKIEGLKPSADYNFSLEYRSWEFDNLVLNKDLGVWTAGNLENQDITKTYSYQITGKIEFIGNEDITIKAMLVKYDKRKNSWKITQKTKLDSNSEFKFDNIQPNQNIIYYVCAGVKVSDSAGTHYTRFNATKGDENLSEFDRNSSIIISNFAKVTN